MTDDQDRSETPEAATGDGEVASLEAAIAETLEPEFEVLRAIGSGRTAHVFLARETGLQRLVAVKVLRPELGEDETVRARFEREAHSEAGVRHPNIPAVHRVGRLPSGLPFMVQEFVEGRTLADRLAATGAIRPAETRSILADLASALSASHSKGVIHRDVRPENVMLESGTGRAFLMDFGLAAVRDSGTQSSDRITRTGEILGDPHFASPEQLRGDKVTAQADIYSLGVLGYEMMTRSNPFGSGSRQELFIAHLRGEPQDLPWEVTVQDPEIGDILKRCLHKDPARRPTAEDVRKALSDDDKRTASRGAARPAPEAGFLAPFPRLAAFVAELRRRHVYQVTVAYIVGAFVILQAAQIVLEGLSAPEPIFQIIVILTLVGFPVIIVFAWVFDVTRKGIKRTESVEGGSGGRGLLVVALVVSVLLVVLLGWLLLR